MRKAFILPALIAGALALSGCATLKGGAIGAAAGATGSAVTGNDVKKGAVVGGAAGAVVGTVVGD